MDTMLEKKRIFLLIFLLYFIPTGIQFAFTEQNTIAGIYLGLPIMQTGDEPHYYITLYSLVNDGDIFLTNNYNAALYRNGSDLGSKNWNSSNRHTRLFNSVNKSVMNIPFKDKTNLNLEYLPSENDEIKEISGHPLGLPLFAFLFLWFLKHTPFLEHAAIFFTLIFSLLGIWAFYKLLLFYHTEEKKALLFTLVFAFATQYWHYAKTFWAEPYLASFLIMSWYLVAVKKTGGAYIFGGFLLGVGFLMKYPFLMVIFPFYLLFLSEKKFKESLLFSTPILLCFMSALSLNYYLTGNFFQFNQAEAVQFVFPLIGIIQWLLNPVFGLLPFSLILLFSIFGVKKFWQKNKIHCFCLASILCLYFLFWAAYIVSQNGGGGYSARYIVPLIPFFVLFCSFSDAESSPHFFIRYSFYILLIFSLVINLFAAFAYSAFTGYSLVVSLQKIVDFLSF